MYMLIPSCKDESDPTITRQKNLIEFHSIGKVEIMYANFQAPAATNRNFLLDMVEPGAEVIMLDDDITGFYPGWNVDLVSAIDDNTRLVSARLMNVDRSFGCMMDIKPEEREDAQVVESGYVPSACIAFREDGTRFDEGFSYEGSGWEDTDFCRQLIEKYPGKKTIVANWCKLVHINEMKNQKLHGGNYHYYCRKWRLAQ